MGDFLKAALQTLHDQGKPLSSVELVIACFQNRLLQSRGKTPENTMRARLSEELRKNGATSIFQRVGKNRFALREWKLKEYVAPEFRKDVSEEDVVCYPSGNILFENNTINGIFRIFPNAEALLKNREGMLIIARKYAERTLDYKQLVSYVILRAKDEGILTYIRGKYSTAHKTLLRGRQSIGFGGHVLKEDASNIFSLNDSGVVNAAKREISEELKGYSVVDCKTIRVIHDSTSQEGYKHFGVVLESYLPENFNYNKYRRELSINGIKLQTPKELWENFHLFEYWSQLIIKDIFKEDKPHCISTISPLKRPKDSNNVVLVGEIASGKTSILTTLSEMFGYHYVSARQCLVEILNIPDFNTGNRTEFQEKAQALITQKQGPLTLARKIAGKVDGNRISLIDGIRNVATIKELRSLLGDCIIVYVDCPRDKALENFKKRAERQFINDEFVKAREHPTELELPLIVEEADAILFNADTLQKTIQIFSKWLGKKQ